MNTVCEKAEKPLFIKDRMKQIHLHLVERGVRDQITLIAGGGIAMAEHMAKLIICGADAADRRYSAPRGHGVQGMPPLQGRYCLSCRARERRPCLGRRAGSGTLWQAGTTSFSRSLGAMGIREVRRLRGEMGRAMFFEDLEKEIFATHGQKGLMQWQSKHKDSHFLK